jgi:vancomycin aglycone glucosyltransferase
VRAAGSRGAAGPYPRALVPVGQPVRPLVTGATPPSAANLRRRAGELVAAQFDTVAAVAEECDALVATGALPTGVWR